MWFGGSVLCQDSKYLIWALFWSNGNSKSELTSRQWWLQASESYMITYDLMLQKVPCDMKTSDPLTSCETFPDSHQQMYLSELCQSLKESKLPSCTSLFQLSVGCASSLCINWLVYVHYRLCPKSPGRKSTRAAGAYNSWQSAPRSTSTQLFSKCNVHFTQTQTLCGYGYKSKH